jgi:hypothetical protein
MQGGTPFSGVSALSTAGSFGLGGAAQTGGFGGMPPMGAGFAQQVCSFHLHLDVTMCLFTLDTVCTSIFWNQWHGSRLTDHVRAATAAAGLYNETYFASTFRFWMDGRYTE